MTLLDQASTVTDWDLGACYTNSGPPCIPHSFHRYSNKNLEVFPPPAPQPRVSQTRQRLPACGSTTMPCSWCGPRWCYVIPPTTSHEQRFTEGRQIFSLQLQPNTVSKVRNCYPSFCRLTRSLLQDSQVPTARAEAQTTSRCESQASSDGTRICSESRFWRVACTGQTRCLSRLSSQSNQITIVKYSFKVMDPNTNNMSKRRKSKISDKPKALERRSFQGM